MRIGYSTGSYPRAADTFIQQEIANLRLLGIDVETFAVRPPPEGEMVGEEQRTERDRTLYLLPVGVLHLVLSHLRCLARRPRGYAAAFRLALAMRPPGVRALLRQLFYFAEAALLSRAVEGRRIGHLHNHLADSSCSVALLASVMGSFTFSFTIHGSYIFFEAQRWRIDLKVKQAVFVVCISKFTRSQVMMFSSPSDWEKLRVVHCGVDPTRYKPRVHAGPGSRLLFVGRLTPGKGVSLLLESVRRLESEPLDAVLTVVGDGDYRAELERLALELRISSRVTFLGYQSQTAVRRLLAEADVFVLPSFAEGVPVSLMEAMAAGLPVVATAVGGVSELVEHERTGLVVPPGDVEALTAALERLILNADLRNELARAGRAKVEREFDGRAEASKLRDVLSEAGCLEAGRRAHR